MGSNQERTFSVQDLIQLLGASMASQDEDHDYEVDVFGEGLIRYLIREDGVWVSFAEGLSSLTGYPSIELEKQWMLKSGQRVWGLRGGKPLLPIPFTLPQLREFNKRAEGVCTNQIIYLGWSETLEAITRLAATPSPGAADLARAVLFPPCLSQEIMSILRNDPAALPSQHLQPDSQEEPNEPTESLEALTILRSPGDELAAGRDDQRRPRVAWMRALYALLPSIISEKGRSVTTVVREMKKRGARYNILDKGKADELVWKDDQGTEQTTVKKTVSNAIKPAICELKKTGKIPA